MNNKTIKNVAASVRERLYQLAQKRGEDFQLILTRYGLERLLYRLGRSPYHDRFVLKGAMLFSLWGGEMYRATRDVDFLGFGDSSAKEMEKVFRELCGTPVEDDGLVFRADTVVAESIRDAMDYGGIRVTLEARLAQARIPIQADIGFGDAVTPAAEEIEYPTLLDTPAPKVRAYPRETVIAEKFEAIVRLGIINSRMKDFYDLWVMARTFDRWRETQRSHTTDLRTAQDRASKVRTDGLHPGVPRGQNEADPVAGVFGQGTGNQGEGVTRRCDQGVARFSGAPHRGLGLRKNIQDALDTWQGVDGSVIPGRSPGALWRKRGVVPKRG